MYIKKGHEKGAHSLSTINMSTLGKFKQVERVFTFMLLVIAIGVVSAGEPFPNTRRRSL